ncbi:leucine-rich repeat domain-containing protein [Aquimarina pacifica]|uniref:leucine-rich repeat domain-containing protein n=1 Tax=Aquimarina pacifica TaxID=1296415 RepID=UPI000471D614|nr:leucine-rich repeat domain-containing protein [Aquimarina pacifica]
MNLAELKQEADKVLSSENKNYLNLNGKLKELNQTELKELLQYISEKLPNLEELRLADNNLVALPEEIGKLTNLKILSLNDNDIVHIPDAILDLEKLWLLNASNNNLQAIPDKIDNLPNLRNLDISTNNLSYLPEALGTIDSLTNLNISDNTAIKELPENLYIKFGEEKLKIKYDNASNELKESFKTYEQQLLAIQREESRVTALNYLRDHINDDETALERVRQTLTKLDEDNELFTTGNGKQYSASEVIKDFFKKFPREGEEYQKYFDNAAKELLKLSKLENPETSKDLFASLAVPLGNCNTPVYDFVLEAVFDLNKDTPEIKPLILRMAVKEKIDNEFALKLRSIDDSEIIEKTNALVNSVLLFDAENMELNHLKITGDRMYAPSSSDHVGAMEYFRDTRYKTILKDTAKLFCKTKRNGKLLKKNGKYIIDNNKLNNTLNTYLFKKNRINEIETKDPNFIKKLGDIEKYKEAVGIDINKMITQLDKEKKIDIYDTPVAEKLENYMGEIMEDLGNFLIEKKDVKRGYGEFKTKVKNKLKGLYKEAKLGSGKKKDTRIFAMMSSVPARLKKNRKRTNTSRANINNNRSRRSQPGIG